MTYVKLRDCRTSSMKSILRDIGVDSAYWSRIECITYLEHMDIFHLENNEPHAETHIELPVNHIEPVTRSVPVHSIAPRSRGHSQSHQTYGLKNDSSAKNVVVYGTSNLKSIVMNGQNMLSIIADATESVNNASLIVSTLNDSIDTVFTTIQDNTLNTRYASSYSKQDVDFSVEYPSMNVPWVTEDSWIPIESGQQITTTNSTVDWKCSLKFEVIPDSNRQTAPSKLRIKLPYAIDTASFEYQYPVAAYVEIKTSVASSIIPVKYAFVDANDSTHLYVDHAARDAYFDKSPIEWIAVHVDASYYPDTVSVVHQTPMRIDFTNVQNLSNNDFILPTAYSFSEGRMTWSKVSDRIVLHGQFKLMRYTQSDEHIRVVLPVPSHSPSLVHDIGRGLVSMNGNTYETQLFIEPSSPDTMVVVHPITLLGELDFRIHISYSEPYETIVRLDEPIYEFDTVPTSVLTVDNVVFRNVASIANGSDDKNQLEYTIQSQWELRLSIHEDSTQTLTKNVAITDQLILSPYVYCDIQIGATEVDCQRVHAHDYTYKGREYIKNNNNYVIQLRACQQPFSPVCIRRQLPSICTSAHRLFARNPSVRQSDTVVTEITLRRHRRLTRQLHRSATSSTCRYTSTDVVVRVTNPFTVIRLTCVRQPVHHKKCNDT
jgi:hypothetical protein